MSKQKTTEEARAEVIALGRKPGPNFEYKNSEIKMQLECPYGVFYCMRMDGVVAGHCCTCKNCRPELCSKTTEEAQAEVIALGRKPGPNFEYVNAKTKMQLECPHGVFYYALMHHVVSGKGCTCKNCRAPHTSKTTEEARAQVIFLGHEPGPDFKYENCESKMQLRCSNGHFYHMTMGNIVNGEGCNCDECSGLKRERRCREWLENKFQKNFQKFKPKWLRNHTGRCMELDGYCEELKLAFEYNGRQHYKPCRFSNSQTNEEIMKKFDGQQQRDALKMKLCKENGVRLIVVPYYEKNVEEFLEKQLAIISVGTSL